MTQLPNGWEMVVGLEVHTELLTKSKPVSYTHLTLPTNREV